MFGIVRHQASLSYAPARCRRMASVAAGRLFNVTVGATGVANRILRSSELPTSWSIAVIVIAVTSATGVMPAMAAIDLSAGATIGIEHDSNPLEIRDSQAQDFVTRGLISRQDDTVKRLTANVAAVSGANGPTQVQLKASYSKVDNVHLDTLDHTEYNVGGNLDWKPSQMFDVSLQASQNRTPVGLNDIGGDQVVQQTIREAEGTLRLRPTPHWQLSLTPSWSDNERPLPGARNFKLRESSDTLGLGYLGAGRLVPGLFVTESRGRYSGIDNPTRYQQQSVGVSLNYKVTDFSSFTLLAAHTQRTTHLIEPTNNPQALSLEGTQPAYTGTLGYQRQLSVKTAIYVSAFRNFQQYDAGINTTLGTGLATGVTWKATAKLSATLDSTIVRLTIDNPQIVGSLNERKDLARSYSLGVKYLVTQHVSLRPYFTRLIHNSTGRTAVFDKTIAGLELTFKVD
jgi:hypothetical protein